MSVCAKFDVLTTAEGVDSGYIALGLIVGIIVGFILAFILFWIFCFHMKFKSRSYSVCILDKIYCVKADISCGMKFSKITTCLERKNRKVDDENPDYQRDAATSHESMRLRKRKSDASDPRALTNDGMDEAEEGVLVRLILYDPNASFSSDRDHLPMIDAITQVTEQDGEQELLQQDWTAAGQQERDLWRSRLLGLWQLAGALINRLARQGSIDEATRRQLLREHTDHLAEARARVESELVEDRRRRGESKATSTESAADAADAEEAKRAAALDSAAQSEIARLRRQISGLPGLAAEQADVLVATLKAGVARLESRLAGQRLRQCAGMEESLARRRQLLAQQKAADEEAAYGIEQLMESRRLQLSGLVRDKKMTEADKQRLMANYQKSLLKQKEAFEKSYLSQRQTLAERLRQGRRAQSLELERRHTAELGRLTGRVEAGTETEPERVLDEFAGLLEARTAQREALQEELDSRDCGQLDVLRGDLLEEKRHGENQAEEELGRQLGLPEEDLGRMLDLHRRQVDKFRKDKRNEQQRGQRKLEEKLAQRQAKFAAAQQAREAELAEVKRGQDLLLRKALTLQLDMDDQARAQIIEEHERQLLALGNSLQLSRLRQEKGLEAKLAARRAGMARLQRDTREAKLALDEAKLVAPGGEGERLEAKLAARLEEEQQKLLAESREGRRRLRDRLAAETEAALTAQEARLSEAIGRLQTGQARRRGVIDSQEKVLRQLEAELEAKLAGASDGGDRRGNSGGDIRGLDQILQSHKNQVATLTDQIDREKRQQEMLLKERLERRRLEREDEVKQTVDREEQEASKALDKSGHGAGQIARYVLELSLDAKFRNSMLSMEEEMRLDMKKQQEQLDRDMEADLQKSLEDQRKRLFGELAKLTNIPKSEMQEMVDRAGETAGAGRRLTRQVSKDITEGVRQMKREDADDATDKGRRDSRRPSSSMKASSRGGKQYRDDFEADD